MEGERLKSPFLRTLIWRRNAWLWLLTLTLAMGCGEKSKMHMPISNKKSPITFRAAGPHHRLDITIGSADVAPEESGALSMKDSIRIDLVRPDGKTLAHVIAKSGQSLQPYKQVTLSQFLWETEDSTQITGESLIWDREAALPIHAQGDVELITSEGLVMGEDLQGDLLLRQFEIQRVISVMRWDDVAGDTIQTPQ